MDRAIRWLCGSALLLGALALGLLAAPPGYAAATNPALDTKAQQDAPSAFAAKHK